MSSSKTEEASVDPNQIEYEKHLGKGTYGDVYRAKWNNQIVAVKKFDKIQKKSYDIELTQLRKVKHPNIIKVLGTGYDEYIYLIILPYAEGGALEKIVHGNSVYSTLQASNWLQQTAKGVAYLHSQTPKPLIHRDIKPANLLLTEDLCKILICDFGTVAEHKTSMTKERGTESYIAPEVFQTSKYNEKCDVYSWGIVFWEVWTRKKPFRDISMKIRNDKIGEICGGKRPNIDEILCIPVKNLIISCWHADPEKRPTMEEVVLKMQEIIKQGNK